MFNDKTQRRNINTPTLDSLESQPTTSASATSFVASSVGSYFFENGRQKAKQAFNIYSHIDYLRPYFDVEPKDVLNRLLKSCLPIEYGYKLQTELYGPLMLIFTLSAILIYQMKLANHLVEDGTLIGTAFFLCFTYWIGLSGLLASTSFICSSAISLFNFLSLIGYSLFSDCVVLLIGTFVHTRYDHLMFYTLWFFLGGAAALKLAYVIFAHTPHPRYRILLGLFAIFMHLGFLLYLHFAYHDLAEEVSHALFEKETLPPMLRPTKLSDSVTQSILIKTNPVEKLVVTVDRKKLLRQVRELNATTLSNNTSTI